MGAQHADSNGHGQKVSWQMEKVILFLKLQLQHHKRGGLVLLN